MDVSVLEITYYALLLGAGSLVSIIMFSLLAGEFVSQVRVQRRKLRLAVQEAKKETERKARVEMRRRIQEQLIAQEREEAAKTIADAAAAAKKRTVPQAAPQPAAPAPSAEKPPAVPTPPKPAPRPKPAPPGKKKEKKKETEEMRRVREELEEAEMKAGKVTKTDLISDKMKEAKPEKLAGLVRAVMHTGRD
ncbi:MAG: hypothetical protein E3J72_13000 [Planctomycetota bacterium]|nr:MAG: hypothetical protein E3J72_13000 [Planctomycetota bacterium]